MSLDVYLRTETPQTKKSSGIFIRENGSTVELTIEEWNDRYPDRQAMIVAEEEHESNEVYSANITHNLGRIAVECGVYEACWQPEENGITHASQLIEPLTEAIAKLKGNPDYYKQFNPKNGWGDYDGFVKFLEQYLKACKESPEAMVSVSR